MTNDEREVMEAELEAIKKLLNSNEGALKDLQKENRQTASVAGLFVFICIGVFLPLLTSYEPILGSSNYSHGVSETVFGFHPTQRS